MSKSFQSRTRASAPTPRGLNGGHQLLGRPFVVKQQSLSSDSSVSKTDLARLQQLDAGVLQTLGLQAKLENKALGNESEQEVDQVAARIIQPINSSQLIPCLQRHNMLNKGRQESIGQSMGRYFDGGQTHTSFQSGQLNQPIMQPKWLEPEQGHLLRWDSLLNGLRWSFNRITGKMSFHIEADLQVPMEVWDTVEALEGVEKNYRDWLSTEIFSSGNWQESDAELIPKEQPQSKTLSGVKMAVDRDVAQQIAERVTAGQPGLDPNFAGKNGGASFFVAEGNPYTGVLAEQSVEVKLTIDVPPGYLAITDNDLLDIHCSELIDLAVREYSANREKLESIRQDLYLYLKKIKTKHTDFDQKYSQLGFTSNGQFKKFLQFGRRAAEHHLWNAVGARVVASGTGIGMVVMNSIEHVTSSPGKFLVVAPRAILSCFVTGGDRTFEDILNGLR